jgi:hypothetical protein
MSIDYTRLAEHLKKNKKTLDSMSDKEYNEYLNQLLEDFHYQHPLKHDRQQNRSLSDIQQENKKNN